MNLIEELEKIKKESHKNVNESLLVKEANMLLEHNANEDKEILRQAGLDHIIKKGEDEIGQLLEQKEIDESYGGEVFTKDQIRTTCIKYGLRFLNSAYYNGNIPSTLAIDIKKFCDENKLSIYSRDFFIMAPRSNFILQKKPKDPILFYRVIASYDTGDHYKIITKWGDDFSWGRRIIGFFTSPDNWNSKYED